MFLGTNDCKYRCHCPIGDLEECEVVKDPGARSRGSGFDKFDNESDAAAAIKSLNGYVMGSGPDNERPFRPQCARKSLQPGPSAVSTPAAASSAPAISSRGNQKPRAHVGPVENQIYCGNLPEDLRASHLKSIFSEYSE